MLQAQGWGRLPVKTIAFDHHYLTSAVVQTVTKLGLDWVSKAGKDDHACFKGAWLGLDEILPRLPRPSSKRSGCKPAMDADAIGFVHNGCFCVPSTKANGS